MNVTSTVGVAPEVSAPVRTEGQANSEVLFNWMIVKGYLWMLDDLYIERLGSLVGLSAGVKLLRRMNQRGGLALISKIGPPEDGEKIKEAFDRLSKLLDAHFFGSEVTNASEGT